jgi:hypothetical protein
VARESEAEARALLESLQNPPAADSGAESGQDENFSLAKSFPITESMRVDLRWEMFNALNRFRPSPGSTNVQDPNFSRVQSQLNEPRRMQFGLKLYF